MNLNEVLNSINYNKEDIFDGLPNVTQKEYVPFVVNKCLSYFPDTILQANAMNMRHHLDNRMQYHYFIGSVRKKKRFSKWNKNEKNKKIEVIKTHFGYSNQKAEEALLVLGDRQIEKILNLYNNKT